MDLTPVASSNLEALGYCAETATLRVRFRSGAEYDYAGVPPPAYAALLASPSKGSYLAGAIKGQYPAVRVSPLPDSPPRSTA